MASFKHLSAAELSGWLQDKNLQIVDIRDEASYQAGHIQGAQHLDNTTLQKFIESADLDAPLVVCCYHGNSSQSAAAYLSEKGFDHVYSLDGGFEMWRVAFPHFVENASA
jgi:thiosulfate sulfurtransferase